ncbi:Uncharacterised protein [Mycobacteroides abscessus subsp. abscessus]|nr:Uncharacterised protein [Mycobacteroides abscessus subsp. abscessus]
MYPAKAAILHALWHMTEKRRSAPSFMKKYQAAAGMNPEDPFLGRMTDYCILPMDRFPKTASASLQALQ